MRIILTLITLFWIVNPVAVVADEASQEQAGILLDVMDTKLIMQQSMEQMLDLQIQQNPDIGRYREVMLEFLAKYMSYESVRPELVTLYADAFTADELREIIAFNRTPTGQKALNLVPHLMQQGASIGIQRVQDNIGELQKMIEEVQANATKEN